jgi:hypothetical protein
MLLLAGAGLDACAQQVVKDALFLMVSEMTQPARNWSAMRPASYGEVRAEIAQRRASIPQR